MIEQLINWLTDWLNNWLIDWLIDWLIKWLTQWLIHWFTTSLTIDMSSRSNPKLLALSVSSSFTRCDTTSRCVINSLASNSAYSEQERYHMIVTRQSHANYNNWVVARLHSVPPVQYMKRIGRTGCSLDQWFWHWWLTNRKPRVWVSVTTRTGLGMRLGSYHNSLEHFCGNWGEDPLIIVHPDIRVYPWQLVILWPEEDS